MGLNDYSQCLTQLDLLNDTSFYLMQISPTVTPNDISSFKCIYANKSLPTPHQKNFWLCVNDTVRPFQTLKQMLSMVEIVLFQGGN